VTFKVIQGHLQRHHWIDHIRFPISPPLVTISLSYRFPSCYRLFAKIKRGHVTLNTPLLGAFVIVKLTLPSSVHVVHVPNLKCLASFVTKKAKLSTQKVPQTWFMVVRARSGSLKMVPFYRSHMTFY